MKCPHCIDGKVTLFTSVTDCEHCNTHWINSPAANQEHQPKFTVKSSVTSVRCKPSELCKMLMILLDRNPKLTIKDISKKTARSMSWICDILSLIQ